MSARQFPRASAGILMACIGLGGLAACKDPDPVTTVANVTTPLPPYPAWANGMIGQNVGHVLTGHGTCLGTWDTLSAKHVATRPGYEGEGWAWDAAAKAPIQHVLFVNADNIIVGAGDSGLLRDDVSKARPEITSTKTGWHGIIGVTAGKVLAVGVTSKNASCAVGAFDLSATTAP